MKGKKRYVTISLSADLYDYIQTRIEDKTFASISHACELALTRYREEEKKRKDPL